ncbi:hypothetical protein Glove_19g133 [Diversispora epigaea]|uniref:TLDc domain-containing protein n=1 Tax=Diversispora epigaea TaxID=1348612 RepID=A0A397JKV1_9GLOM|nr:hypothetical protein Glove_19g133 [Diversispora epigaea]
MKSLQEFTSLHESNLVSILKIEDLQMNELEIWGTAQNSTIPENVMYKIKSYKKILNKKIWNGLKKLLMLPDQSVESIIFPSKLVVKQELPARIIELFSTIINEEHTAMISSNTIVVTKVKGKSKILGIFNSSAWDRTKVRDMKINKSFIFSFKDGNI